MLKKLAPVIFGQLGLCRAQERMARKLRTEKGREIYAKRKTNPELVFGQTKEGRDLR